MEGFIKINPSKELIFPLAAIYDVYTHVKIKLTNSSDEKIAYLIETNNTDTYVIHDDRGIIEPNRSMTLFCNLQKGKACQSDDKFYLFFTFAGDTSVSDINNVLFENLESVIKHTLNCKLQLPTNFESLSEINGFNIEEYLKYIRDTADFPESAHTFCGKFEDLVSTNFKEMDELENQEEFSNFLKKFQDAQSFTHSSQTNVSENQSQDFPSNNLSVEFPIDEDLSLRNSLGLESDRDFDLRTCLNISPKGHLYFCEDKKMAVITLENDSSYKVAYTLQTSNFKSYQACSPRGIIGTEAMAEIHVKLVGNRCQWDDQILVKIVMLEAGMTKQNLNDRFNSLPSNSSLFYLYQCVLIESSKDLRLVTGNFMRNYFKTEFQELKNWISNQCNKLIVQSLFVAFFILISCIILPIWLKKY